jgi:hypothetical protein
MVLSPLYGQDQSKKEEAKIRRISTLLSEPRKSLYQDSLYT